MIVQKLSLINFKNYPQVEIDFGSGINCLLGNNGEGKTNVLDAIYLTAFCKSYFNAVDSHNIRFEEDMYMVQAQYHKDDEQHDILCSVKKGRKKVFKRNKVDYERLSDHIGRYPVVMITPYDSNLILGGSELRRKFLNSIISQVDLTYLNHLVAYQKVLDQRNALLKNTPYSQSLNLDVLDIYDEQLIRHGSYIAQKRKDFVESDLVPWFNQQHQVLSDQKEAVSLSYLSSVKDGQYESTLKASLDKDRATQYTNVGVHKDDLSFLIDTYPLKKFASQGQQKTYLISLKLAYYAYLRNQLGYAPILLLDDIFDKLDKDRVMALMSLISDKDAGQTFITDTSQERLPAILDELKLEYKAFKVDNNQLYEA